MLKPDRVDKYSWRIRKQGRMRTDALIYASEKLFNDLSGDQCLQQIANVATLPGIVGSALAMPDIHGGYGFPIGGVAAFDLDTGVISPGGVGYDINCGVRLLRTDLAAEDIADKHEELLAALSQRVPAGLGSRAGGLSLSRKELDQVMRQGASFAVERGYGSSSDPDHIEARGRLDSADPERVSKKAKQRGSEQLGTLGSGNHFVEVGYVDEIFDPAAAEVMGLGEGSITVAIHTGSRGLGHQIATDAIARMLQASRRYGIDLPDRQLCCAPLSSPEGQEYLAAMACAANFAFANRQVIAGQICAAFERALRQGAAHLGLRTVYDVAHNIAKIEHHLIDGQRQQVCVHRKGATRAFPPGHPEVPADYREIGQPVLVPGDMGRCSYVLVGRQAAMESSFGSTCHGAGRLLSRGAAKQRAKGRDLRRELGERGVSVRAASRQTLAEEMPDAYKDVEEVVRVVRQAGLSQPVARLRPLVVVKG